MGGQNNIGCVPYTTEPEDDLSLITTRFGQLEIDNDSMYIGNAFWMSLYNEVSRLRVILAPFAK
jgi:hypothetical protein